MSPVKNEVDAKDLFWRDKYKVWGWWFVVMWFGILVFLYGFMYILNREYIMDSIFLVIAGAAIFLVSILELKRRWKKFKKEHVVRC